MEITGQAVWGRVLLTQRQVGVVGPLPSLEEYKYAITHVDMATGLLAAYPAWHQDQNAAITALDHLRTACG